MLGIDINENSIRVVMLKPKRDKIAVCEAFTLCCDGETDVTVWGDALLKKLTVCNLDKSNAVIAVGQRPSLVRRYNIPASSAIDNHNDKQLLDSISGLINDSLLGSAQDMVIDLWQPSPELSNCDFVLAAPAHKNQITFARKLAEYCNLKLKAIDLRSTAIVNCLNCNKNISSPGSRAVIFRDEARVFLALYDEYGLLNIQAFVASNTGDGLEDAGSIIRIFNTMKLNQAGLTLPTCLYISDNEPHAGLTLWAKSLADTLAAQTSAQIIICPIDSGLLWLNEPQEPQQVYAAAVGAALNGLYLAGECFDFLHIKEKKTPQDKKVNRTLALTFGSLFLILMLIAWFGIIGQRKNLISKLDADIALNQQNKIPVFQAQELWLNCSGYVSQGKGGSRMEYLSILYEITRLMPSSEKAYITSMSVFSDRTIYGYNVKLSIKANEVALISYITGNLNTSPLFRDIQDGGRTNDKTDLFYPTSFTITFNINRPGILQPTTKEPAKL